MTNIILLCALALLIATSSPGSPIPSHVPPLTLLTFDVSAQTGQTLFYINDRGLVVGVGHDDHYITGRYWRTDDPSIYYTIAPDHVEVAGLDAALAHQSGWLVPPCAEHTVTPLDVDDSGRVLLRAPTPTWNGGGGQVWCPSNPTWVPHPDLYIELIFDTNTRQWSQHDGSWQFQQRTSNNRGQYISNEVRQGQQVGLLYSPVATPEPGSYALLASAIALLGVSKRKAARNM